MPKASVEFEYAIGDAVSLLSIQRPARITALLRG